MNLRGIILFGLLILILGGGLLYFGIIGKILTKIHAPKKKEDHFE